MMARNLPLKSGSNRQQRGSSLIEVMVAVVLLSIGLISIAGLVSRSLAAGNSAGYRAAAARNAAAMGDALRSNWAGAVSGRYTIGIGAPPTGSTKEQTELRGWKTAMLAIPGGDGTITVDPVREQATITVTWGSNMADAINGESYVLTVYF
jgi:type IV pilus assembly protein PilV